MTDHEALVRLAGLVGIETQFTDALGQLREAPDQSLMALTGAFGFPSDPARAAAEIEEFERAAPLGAPAVHLVDAEDPHPQIELGRSARARKIAWACRLEDGAQRAGRSAVEDGAAPGRCALPLPAGLPLGYHQLALEAGSEAAQLELIVAPARCHLPPQLEPGARSWGLTCQLYGLRSADDWGVGDFSSLAAIAAAAGSCGAAVLGVNPLHARFAAEPLHCSPYSPSSRIWLDYLCIDPAAMPGFAEDEAVRQLIAGEWFGATRWAARSAELIDYGAAAACKRAVLEALWRSFCAVDLGGGDLGGGDASSTDRAREFRLFQRNGGRDLRDFATFEALHEHHCRDRRGFSWRNWPAPLRNPRSREVTDFAAAHRDRVEFFQFLQWEADRQLGVAAAAGLSVGLYRDFAVGANPNGAEAWADQELVTPSASIGAPPDTLNRAGQNWGLAPVNPLVLRRQRFAPFIACLRANMRHSGVLRIDHVMALRRLYWIPNGMAATQGCYVRYPFEDLLRLVALESCRHACAVVGEDLGTVPEGFRQTMRAANVLSYRIMSFERRRDGGFVPPSEYPPLSAASAATHDLATLAGFWLGRDIAWRRALGLYPDADAEAAETAERARDRRLLLDALADEGLLTARDFSKFLPETGEPVYTPELGDAIQSYLARSHARLMLVQIEDVIAEREQANLPGTTDAHPNWRRRLGHTLDEIIDGGELRRIASLIREARRRSAEA
ncbi:MAG: 4-alpha-glucanotransferase [Stellaceae bacterium]